MYPQAYEYRKISVLEKVHIANNDKYGLVFSKSKYIVEIYELG